jgi:uncharacterized RDD family membrane protein YckC
VNAVGTLALVQLLVGAVYTIVLIRLRGATLGKMAVGVRVRPWETEANPSWGQSGLRWLGREGLGAVPFVGGLYQLVDALWCLWDPRRQCLHDKLPKTVVVKSR